MQAGLQARSRVDIEFQPRCVRVCARACPRVCLPVSRGEGAGLEAAANHGPRGAEPSAPPSRGAQEL